MISTALYMVDTMMIGQLGEVALSGVGAANQLSFLVDICLFGVTSGGSILCAQYWGKRDQQGVRAAMGLSLVLGLVTTGLSLAIAQFLTPQVVGIFSSDAPVIDQGVRYLRIASYGYLLKSVTYAYGTAHKSTERPTLPMITGLVGIVTNVILNYCLIYGHWGFPRLEVEGAAIATIIGISLDAALLILLTYARKTPAAARPGEMFRQSRADVRNYARLTAPMFLSDLVWALGINLYNYLYGQMGTDAFAAITIYSTIEKLAFVSFIAVGSGCGVMIGNIIGEGRMDMAYPYAKRFLVLTGSIGVVTGVLLMLFGPGLLVFFEVSAAVNKMASDMLRITGWLMMLNSINHCVIVGILRAGGDTRAALALDVGPMWLVGIPIVAVTGLLLHWPPQAAFLLSSLADLVRMVFCLLRVKQKKWIKDVTVAHGQDGAAPSAPA